MMKILKQATLLVGSLGLLTVTACTSQPDDAAIQSSANETIQSSGNYSGVTASVKDGVVILSGECEGANCSSEIEKKLKENDNIDSVQNNIRQTDIKTDLTMRTAMQSILTNYEGVQADISNGEITLRGTISKAQLQPLMNEIATLHPKK